MKASWFRYYFVQDGKVYSGQVAGGSTENPSLIDIRPEPEETLKLAQQEAYRRRKSA